MRPPGLILAGGQSSRMGENKALLQLGQDSILGHALRRLTPQVSTLAINAADPFLGFEAYAVVPDGIAGQLGPLAGILTGMRHYAAQDRRTTHFASAPCDSPFLPLDLVARMAAASLIRTQSSSPLRWNAVIPFSASGRSLWRTIFSTGWSMAAIIASMRSSTVTIR